jgi:hypothetical protein
MSSNYWVIVEILLDHGALLGHEAHRSRPLPLGWAATTGNVAMFEGPMWRRSDTASTSIPTRRTPRDRYRSC